MKLPLTASNSIWWTETDTCAVSIPLLKPERCRTCSRTCVTSSRIQPNRSRLHADEATASFFFDGGLVIECHRSGRQIDRESDEFGRRSCGGALRQPR